MNTEKLKEMMESYVVYPATYEYYFDKVSKYDSELYKALEEYTQTGVMPDFKYKDWTLKMVQEFTMLDAFGTFETMDTMIKKPDYYKHFPYMSFGRK